MPEMPFTIDFVFFFRYIDDTMKNLLKSYNGLPGERRCQALMFYSEVKTLAIPDMNFATPYVKIRIIRKNNLF